MESGGFARLLLLGVAFHALCVLSIFDIYFQSPVESSIRSAEYASSAPAKRVIVFTLDGCRVDKLYKVVAGFPSSFNLNPGDAAAPERNAHSRTPFLGDVMRRRGSWGVSHNRVPTESRPCHVALTAGMYEDPHAVIKNWKQHPVPFDSVFNQSNNAFIFGNRDVAPMLARYAPQAQEEHYSAKEENEMAREDPSLLDVWTFRKMKELFARGNETRDADLYAKLHQDRLVIYCHFLGTDLSGPKYGADSREYLDNIAVVDELIEKTEKMVEKFFEYDGQTAYVVNSDHGMDLRGDHGDENPAKTRTALVAWGAGVQGPVAVNVTDGNIFDIDLPSQSKAEVQMRLEEQKAEERVAAREWATLVGLKRKDAMQTDVAAFISALTGLPYPRNSVGVLPFTYLIKSKFRANAIYANAKQLYQHALRKQDVKRANRGWLFIPYVPLHNRALDLASQMDEALNQISDDEDEVHASNDESYRRVEILSQEMIDICRGAIVYYQRYDWVFLFGSIVLGYVGWALVMVVAYLHSKKFRLRWLFCRALNLKSVAVLLAMTWWRFLANSPATYYLYSVCPVIFWSFAWTHREKLRAAITLRQKDSNIVMPWIHCAWIFLCLELVVQGYTQRAMFSVLLFTLALWPWICNGTAVELYRCSKAIKGRFWRRLLSPSLCWAVSCLFAAIFPYLPTEYSTKTSLVHLGALLTLTFALLVLLNIVPKNKRRSQLKTVLGIETPPVLMALVALHWTVSSLESKAFLSFFLAMLNRMIAITPVLVLLIRLRLQSSTQMTFSRKSEDDGDLECQQPNQDNASLLIERLVHVILAFAPSFALLSKAYEMLFYLALCCVLVSWMQLEATQVSASRSSKRREVHQALIFLLLVQISFFGTSSVTSMTSFKISSAPHFLTHSSSITSQALVVLKLLIPFVVVACAFRLILLLPSGPVSSFTRKKTMYKQRHSLSRYFLLSGVLAEYVAVRFLFLVNNEGSWKQMGNSIAVFCIGNAQILLVPVIVVLAWVFVHDLAPFSLASKGELVERVEFDKAR